MNKFHEHLLHAIFAFFAIRLPKVRMQRSAGHEKAQPLMLWQPPWLEVNGM